MKILSKRSKKPSSNSTTKLPTIIPSVCCKLHDFSSFLKLAPTFFTPEIVAKAVPAKKGKICVQLEKYIREKNVQALDKIKFVLLDEHGQRMSKALNIQKLLCCELYLTKPISDMNNQLFFY